MLHVVAFNLIQLLATAYSLARGGAPERVTGGSLLVATVLTRPWHIAPTTRRRRQRFRFDWISGRADWRRAAGTPRWQLIGFAMLSLLATALIFLATASYARIESVTGTVSLDKGVATIVPSRPGRVAAISVHEGQRVRAGEVLARIRSEEDMIGGTTAPERNRQALDEQDRRLGAQGSLLVQAADAERARLREQVLGAGRRSPACRHRPPINGVSSRRRPATSPTRARSRPADTSAAATWKRARPP